MRDVRDVANKAKAYRDRLDKKKQQETTDIRDSQARVEQLTRDIEQANGIRARERNDLLSALVDVSSRLKVISHEDAARLRVVRDAYGRMSPAEREQLNTWLGPRHVAQEQSMLDKVDDSLSRYDRQMEGGSLVNPRKELVPSFPRLPERTTRRRVRPG